VHYAEVADGTRLRAWLGSPVKVNSMHHQVVNKLAPGFIVTARSKHGNMDGYIEGMEYANLETWFAYCVQWHPEAMLESPEHIAMLELFKPLIAACKGGKI
jgi:putative glutamine amidotransferase